MCRFSELAPVPSVTLVRPYLHSARSHYLQGDGVASASARYLYKEARPTPRYFAMALPVRPSAFIRLAVAM